MSDRAARIDWALLGALAFLVLGIDLGSSFRSAAQRRASTKLTGTVTLTYMGTAAWEISDGTTVILLDPYLSHIVIPSSAPDSFIGRVPEDVLDHLLSGTPLGRMVGPEVMKFGGWQRLNAEYAKQFGIEPPNWPPQAIRNS